MLNEFTEFLLDILFYSVRTLMTLKHVGDL